MGFTGLGKKYILKSLESEGSIFCPSAIKNKDINLLLCICLVHRDESEGILYLSSESHPAGILIKKKQG